MNLLGFFAKKKKERADLVKGNLFYVKGLKNQNTNKKQKHKYTQQKTYFSFFFLFYNVLWVKLKHVTLSNMLDDEATIKIS